jgi:hypothetical protein
MTVKEPPPRHDRGVPRSSNPKNRAYEALGRDLMVHEVLAKAPNWVLVAESTPVRKTQTPVSVYLHRRGFEVARRTEKDDEGAPVFRVYARWNGEVPEFQTMWEG